MINPVIFKTILTSVVILATSLVAWFTSAVNLQADRSSKSWSVVCKTSGFVFYLCVVVLVVLGIICIWQM